MMGWGEDFIKARQGSLYPREPMQGFGRSLLIFIPMALVFGILQSVFGIWADVIVYHADLNKLFDVMKNAKAGAMLSDQMLADYMKASIIGMFPAAVFTIFAAVMASHLGLPGRKGTLPLGWPKIGTMGWLAILGGFWLFSDAIALVVFNVMASGPDETGMVEKSIMTLASDRQLFIFAFLGAVIGAPLVEEILFRGILFAGIMNTRLGPKGAVIITAALWSGAHLMAAPPVFVAILFGMGLVLGWLLLRFGSLWVTIACHTLWNFISTLALFSAGINS